MQTLIQYFQSFLHKQSVYSSKYDPLSTNFIYLFKATASCRQNVCSQFPAPDFIMRFTARWLLGITITRVSRYLSRTVRGDVTLRVAHNRNNGPGITPFIITLTMAVTVIMIHLHHYLKEKGIHRYRLLKVSSLLSRYKFLTWIKGQCLMITCRLDKDT